jgi:tRNA(adenine34) deaminase
VDDEGFMRLALEEARTAARSGETPVGAVIVRDGKVIARAHNRRELHEDPTAHAEILAIREASQALHGWRLLGCKMYVTLEPCPMCAGAMILARLPELVFGACDPKGGAAGLKLNLFEVPYNHTVKVTGGVLANECGSLLQEFFRDLRTSK